MILLKTSPEDIYQTIMSYTTPHEEKNYYFPTTNMKNQKYRESKCFNQVTQKL